MASTITTCPNGHQNRADQHLCAQCGAALAATGGAVYPPSAWPTAGASTVSPITSHGRLEGRSLRPRRDQHRDGVAAEPLVAALIDPLELDSAPRACGAVPTE